MEADRANRLLTSVRNESTVLDRRQSFPVNTWLSHVGGPIVPLGGLVAHRDDAYRVQSIHAAPVERMLWPGLHLRPPLRHVYQLRPPTNADKLREQGHGAYPEDTMAVSAAMAAVDHQQWLDPVSEKVQPAVTNTFAAGGSLGRQVKNFLHGTWLGHPLHPALTDVPLGAWTVALVLDSLEAALGRHACGRSADTAIKVGLIGAVGATITGVTDWPHPEHRARRLGLLHGVV
jgi:hypothetical protein